MSAEAFRPSPIDQFSPESYPPGFVPNELSYRQEPTAQFEAWSRAYKADASNASGQEADTSSLHTNMLGAVAVNGIAGSLTEVLWAIGARQNRVAQTAVIVGPALVQEVAERPNESAYALAA